ncbi:MAG: MATE family efflux transporter, partial [Myxococcota bacterium]
MEAVLDERSSSSEKPYYLKVSDPEQPKGWSRLLINRTLAWNTIRMAMPVVLGMVTQTAINILDTVMVGRLPTEIANPGQAAIGFSLPLMWLVSGSLSAVWVGTQAIASRRFGAGELDEAGKVLSNSVAIAVSTSLVVSVIAWMSVPSLVGTLYDDPASVTLGV